MYIVKQNFCPCITTLYIFFTGNSHRFQESICVQFVRIWYKLDESANENVRLLKYQQIKIKLRREYRTSRFSRKNSTPKDGDLPFASSKCEGYIQ